MKLMVFYKITPETFIEVGKSAFVFPLNHTSSDVTNTKLVCTSEVISYEEETGCFETLNTCYKPKIKLTVRYNNTLETCIEIGKSVSILPFDHTKVLNTKPAKTSEVISYDKTSGCFETKNTFYKPK